ncbi:hypothetical protein [Micromonospora sp. NBC_01699]
MSTCGNRSKKATHRRQNTGARAAGGAGERPAQRP